MTGDMDIDGACILSVSVDRWEREDFFSSFYWMKEERKDRQADGYQRKKQVVSKHNMGYVNISRGSWGYQFTVGTGETVVKVDLHFRYQFISAKLSWSVIEVWTHGAPNPSPSGDVSWLLPTPNDLASPPNKRLLHYLERKALLKFLCWIPGASVSSNLISLKLSFSPVSVFVLSDTYFILLFHHVCFYLF